jgi:hypothetical protein
MNFFFAITLLFSSLAGASGFSLEKVKDLYSKGTNPDASQLSGNWFLTGMATDGDGKYSKGGIKVKGMYYWTLEITKDNPISITSVALGTRPQPQVLRVNADSVAFEHGFDSHIGYLINCKTQTKDALVCLGDSQFDSNRKQIIGITFAR